MAALAGGSVDLAFTAILPVIQAHVKGIEFQIVAPAGWYISDNPQLLMLVRKDSTIAGGRDLNGKTIGCSALNDLSCSAMAAWIDQNGGDSKTVHTLFELPNAALLPALDEGRIDAATLVTPFLDQALASGKARVLAKDYDAISKRFQTAGYVATADFAAKNTDALRRFARAMHDAAVYTNAHLPETVDIVAAYSAFPAAIAKSVRATDPESVDPRNIQPLIDVSAKYGIIDRSFPAAEIISAAAVRPPR